MKITELIKEQEIFVQQAALTLCLLKAYANNPNDFHLLIGLELQKKYQWKEKMKLEHLWECFDELASDIGQQRIAVHFLETGIFPVLKRGKKPGLCISAVIEKFKPFSEEAWSI